MGIIIFSNATKEDSQWTRNGQDVTLTITIGSTKVTLAPGSTKVTLAPDARYVFELKRAGTHTVAAKPQLPAMKKGEHKFKVQSPSGGGTVYVWIMAKYTGQLKLGFFEAPHEYTPPH